MNVKLTSDGAGRWVVRFTEPVGQLVASVIDANDRVQRRVEFWYRILFDLNFKPTVREAALVPTRGGIYVVRDICVDHVNDDLRERVKDAAKEFKAEQKR